MLVTVAVLAALFTYGVSYVVCENTLDSVNTAAQAMMCEADVLLDFVAPLCALGKEHTPQYGPLADWAEQAKERISQHPSAEEVGRAYSQLRQALQVLIRNLDAIVSVRQSGQYPDLRESVRHNVQRFDHAIQAYNEQAQKYNTMLREPVPAFWNKLMQFAPASTVVVDRTVKLPAPQRQPPPTPHRVPQVTEEE